MKNLVILTGPTAVGKTSLSIQLAKAVNGEIISADSMQVYKYMDIGTAKITKEEMAGVKHHLIDCLEPTEDFHVVKFKELAEDAMEDIYKRGKLPIICGGTGFYIQALLYNVQFTENTVDYKYREELEEIAKVQGTNYLHAMLSEIDPDSASNIPAANIKRVIRALEYFHETGERFSIHNEREKNRTSPYNFSYFVLNDQRDLLYDRINKRVDKMLEDGLVDEVKKLMALGVRKGMTAFDGIGYKEILMALEEDGTHNDVIAEIKQNSRHYAKRQLTWFRREKEVTWLDKSKYSDQELLSLMEEELKEKGII